MNVLVDMTRSRPWLMFFLLKFGKTRSSDGFLPCKKINRPLAEAHVGLGITDKEFDIVAGHLVTTLKEFKVPQKEFDELMTKVGGLRDYVVEARIKK
jgi:hypothetical protein